MIFGNRIVLILTERSVYSSLSHHFIRHVAVYIEISTDDCVAEKEHGTHWSTCSFWCAFKLPELQGDITSLCFEYVFSRFNNRDGSHWWLQVMMAILRFWTFFSMQSLTEFKLQMFDINVCFCVLMFCAGTLGDAWRPWSWRHSSSVSSSCADVNGLRIPNKFWLSRTSQWIII